MEARALRHPDLRRHAAGRWIPLHLRFTVEMAFAVFWVVFSTWLALPWIDDLGRLVDPVPAWMAIIGVALLPGYLNAHLLAALVLDRPTPLPDPASLDFPPLTVLCAAFQEE